MTEDSNRSHEYARLERRLKECEAEVQYYKGIAAVSGKRHLRELDQLSRLIAEQRRAEAALRKSEEKYRSILESMEEGYFEVDLEGNMVFFNDSVCRILEYSREELAGMNNRRYASADTSKKMFRIFNEIYRTGNPAKITDYEVITKKGDTKILELSTSLMKGAGNEPTGFRGVARDVTERRRTEQALVSASKELEQTKDMLVHSEKLAALGRVTAGVAHEILNPLNIISMRLQLLGMAKDLPEEAQAALRVCRDQMGRILEITKDLGQFSRITQKHFVPSDLNKMVEGVLNLSSPHLKQEGIKPRVEYRPDLPRVSMDIDRMNQVILNVFSNATAAMKGRKTKELRVSTGLNPDGSVRLVISDTGTGIAEDDLGSIFDPFFTTKAPGQGTGLGLFISYSIVQEHGGKMWAENNSRGGASFFIELPGPER